MSLEICWCTGREHAYDAAECSPNRRLTQPFLPRLEKMAAEAAPRDVGPMAGGITGWTFAYYPRGPHRLLCKLGFHAWQTRRTYRAGILETGHVHRSCTVCGRKAL